MAKYAQNVLNASPRISKFWGGKLPPSREGVTPLSGSPPLARFVPLALNSPSTL